jgi:hypothetical protein
MNPKTDRPQSSSEGVQFAPSQSFDRLDPPKQAPVAPMFGAANAPMAMAPTILSFKVRRPTRGFAGGSRFATRGTFMKEAVSAGPAILCT